MAELQSIIVFHGRHFVNHNGICNRICVELLQLMCAVITHNSVKKRRLYFHKWLSYNQLYCFMAAIFVRHLGICNRMCQTCVNDVRCYYAQFAEKDKVSILING